MAAKRAERLVNLVIALLSTRQFVTAAKIRATVPGYEACYAAARDRRRLEFDYQRPDEEVPARRRVQPWGVVAWHGRWYLVGLDLDRQAPRVFRPSPVVGTPR